jgi:peptidoglycan/LPS O-acetylase OafA/YrhL
MISVATSNSPAAARPRTGAAVCAWFLGRPGAHRTHLDALDGLRGLAVLAVIGSHLSNLGLLPTPGLSGFGKAGVYLFFVLSAFLLTQALLQRSAADFASTRLWLNYALRRVLRIWPLFLVVLFSSWMLTRAGVPGWHYRIDTPALLGHLTLRDGQSVLWSIPVEFTFYLWLPPLALALAWLRTRQWPAWVEVALAMAALGLASWLWPPAESVVNDLRLGPYIVIFFCGSFAAYAEHRLRAAGRLPGPRVWMAIGVAALAACVMAMPSAWAMIWQVPFRPDVSHRWFLFFGLAWSAVLLAVLHGPNWLRAPFAATPMRLVGVVSYSAYLWHMPVLQGLRTLGLPAEPLSGVLVLAATMVVSMISFLLFERPLRDIYLPTPSGASRSRARHPA